MHPKSGQCGIAEPEASENHLPILSKWQGDFSNYDQHAVSQHEAQLEQIRDLQGSLGQTDSLTNLSKRNVVKSQNLGESKS